MHKRSGKKGHGGINPLGAKSGPEYHQQSLQLHAPSVPVAAGQNPKGAMINGPFGGKVKA